MTKLGALHVRYVWHEGSLPPPHYYEYEIEAGPGLEGKIQLCPGYAFQDPPTWVVPFEVERLAWNQMCAIIDRLSVPGYFSLPEVEPAHVGGSRATLHLTTNGQTTRLPIYGTPPDAIAEAVKAAHALVPAALWSDLQAWKKQFANGF